MVIVLSDNDIQVVIVLPGVDCTLALLYIEYIYMIILKLNVSPDGECPVGHSPSGETFSFFTPVVDAPQILLSLEFLVNQYYI